MLGKTKPESRSAAEIDTSVHLLLWYSNFTLAALSVLPNPLPVGPRPMPGFVVEPGTVPGVAIPGVVVPPMLGVVGVVVVDGEVGVPPMVGLEDGVTTPPPLGPVGYTHPEPMLGAFWVTVAVP